MDLKQLKIFTMVAREMHVGRAAERLGIAQPALTRHLRAMEADMGCALVHKTGRGIALTEAGEFLYREAQGVLRDFDALCVRARAIGCGEAGHLRVGLSEAASFEPRLARAFQAFKRTSPDVALSFSQRQSVDLGVAIAQGELDVAFTCPIAAPNPDIRSEIVAVHTMMLALPADSPLARGRRIPLSAIQQQELILISHGYAPGSFEECLNLACARLGFAPRFTQASPELALAVNLVAAGAGAAFIPDYMATLREDAVAYVAVESEVPLAFKLAALTLKRAAAVPAIDKLRKLVRATFREPTPSPAPPPRIHTTSVMDFATD